MTAFAEKLGIICLVSLTLGGPAGADVPSLPRGLSLVEDNGGLVLASSNGALLYQLDIDRLKKLGRERAQLAAARCDAENCMRFWRPVSAPAGFKQDADWSVGRTSTGTRLLYRGMPLYRFVGEKMDDLATGRVSPPYFSSYSSPGIHYLSGVPVAAKYWQTISFDRPTRAIVTPAGIREDRSKLAAELMTSDGAVLYVRRSKHPCPDQCDELQPLVAPLAAEAVGVWSPVVSKRGNLQWNYRGKPVYYAPKGVSRPVGRDWKSIEPR
ncbi:MAG TPA: hypothetical protein VF503_16175 [Sphingobium sp.]|uniref:hypothetical protein n=1 Tax=Sphingobium sp. TaxID=1912891 RepID=UPI002ED2F15E